MLALGAALGEAYALAASVVFVILPCGAFMIGLTLNGMEEKSNRR